MERITTGLSLVLFLALLHRGASENASSLSVGIVLQRSLYSRLEFTRPNIHPQPSFTFAVVNATFLATPECFAELADSSISGPGWMSGLVRSDGILSLTRPPVTPVPVAGVGVTPAPTPAPITNAPPSLPPGTVALSIDDVEMLIYATRDFSGSGSYRLRLPGNCSALGIEFTVDFLIQPDLRTALGKVMTFCILMFAGFSALLALLGSPTMLTVAQCAALLSYSTCGSLGVQEESNVLRFILVPFVVPFTRFDSCNALLVALGLCAIVAVSEALREGWERLRSPVPAPPLLPNGGSAGGAQSQVVAVARPAARGFARIVGRRPLPPHFAIVFFIALYPGIFFYGVRTISDGSSVSIVYSGIGLFSIAIAGLGPVLLTLRIMRNHAAFFCDYTGVGIFPLGMLPLGVWGPQKFRQQLGAPISDFGRGRKGVAPVFCLFVVVLSAVCSLTPSQTTSCQTQLAVCVLACLVMLVAIAASRPFRSSLLNISITICFFGLALFSLSQFIFGSYFYTSPTHWSTTAAMAGGILLGVVGSLAAVCHLFVVILEVASSMATNAVRDAITLRGKSGMMQTKRSRSMRSTSRIGGGQGGSAADGLTTSHGDVPETVVSKMMMEIVALHQQEDIRKRRIGLEVLEVVDSDGKAPSLADYLLQDFEELPQETRDDFVLAVELDEIRLQRQSAFQGVEPMVVHPTDRPKSYHVKQFVEPRRAPPYVQAVTLNAPLPPRVTLREEDSFPEN